MDNVSRIEAFCDDKNVGKVLRLLAGMVYDVPKVTPVVNAKAKGSTLEPATNGRLLSLFSAWLKKSKLTEVTHADLKLFVVSVGRVESAYTKLRADAQAAGVLKKHGAGKTARYVVAGAKAKPKGKGAK